MEVDEPQQGAGAAMEVDENNKPEETTSNPLAGEHSWEVSNVSTIQGKALSEPFEIGGYSWQLLLYPRGNNRPDSLSLYLAVAEEEQQAFGLQRTAVFKLMLLSKEEGGDVVKDTQHTFTVRETDWGEAAGDDRFREGGWVSIEVRVPEDLSYDSRKETGYVGLKNQGATCYMNSLLQTLFNINQFRKAVYHMPTSEDADPATSMPLALQSVFYKLQFTAGPVSTKDLTRSFGWDTADAFQQHDVQELNRILCDRLEEKMKGTRVEGMVNKLFEGHTINYIECINVDYKSTRREPFMDVQLDVKNCKDIYASFDKYCEVEVLEGDNQYNAEQHGMQDARKGILFEGFPPVLQLQLKRFEYDFMKDMMVKVNDRYEFHDTIDLDREGGKYLSASADRAVRNTYKLLAVLVHSGGVHGGHYFAYVRPDGKQWLKFDDERVEKADDQKAIDDNWGGEGEAPPGGFGNPLRFTRHANAYMLVYVRESEWDAVMCQVTEQDISQHVRARLKAEQEDKERRKKEKAEAHLYTLVRVSTDADLAKQIGHDRFFDLVDHDKVKTFKMSRKAPFSELQKRVHDEMGVPPEKQRFWKWAGRQNSTYRPAQVLHLEPGEDPPISSIRESDLLLFFKQYSPDPQQPSLKYAGHRLVPKDAKTKELYPLVRSLGGLLDSEAVELFEEIKFEPTVMVDRLAPTMTLGGAQLEDGDIVVFQRQLSQAEAASVQCPTAKDYLEFVRNRQLVTFRPLEGEGEEGVLELELLKSDSYDDVSKALAGRLGLDHPLKLRLTGQNNLTHMPRPHPLRYRQCESLQDMLKYGFGGQTSTLYYEVIDLPLPEYENLMSFKIAYHNNKLEEVSQHSVRMPKQATIADLLEEVRRQLPAEAQGEVPLRLMEVYQWKIWQLFDPRARVETIGDNTWHLRVEVVPEDQRELDQAGALHAHCLQVAEEPNNQRPFAFSDPFIMRVGPEETVGQLRQRVQAKLGIPVEEFQDSWKPVLVTFGGSEALANDVVVAPRLDSQRLYGHQERNCIGFVHENKNQRRTHAHLNQRLQVWQGQEKALRIRS
ncbi:hypothetical protein COHA_005205 [Chlorella ohadii]|uniref:ubiquitinyl hydrolase 1 n=1 Tax=Chlorella ohadii TaxID=2649997 RepID=A0AAD5DRJ2_9CHLO|nr:hypothetical protein COHA_005205 [Chlorella ohadii]